jgi:hypothetical protein
MFSNEYPRTNSPDHYLVSKLFQPVAPTLAIYHTVYMARVIVTEATHYENIIQDTGLIVIQELYTVIVWETWIDNLTSERQVSSKIFIDI